MERTQNVRADIATLVAALGVHLSASWGTDNAVGRPAGEQGLDNIPVTFNWFIRRPPGAKLTGVTIGGGLIQDPNGDPNVAQKFRTPRRS